MNSTLIDNIETIGMEVNIVQLLHAVTGSMAFCTLEGGNGTRGEAEGAISPRGCTKPMDPNHRVQQLFCDTFV